MKLRISKLLTQFDMTGKQWKAQIWVQRFLSCTTSWLRYKSEEKREVNMYTKWTKSWSSGDNDKYCSIAFSKSFEFKFSPQCLSKFNVRNPHNWWWDTTITTNYTLPWLRWTSASLNLLSLSLDIKKPLFDISSSMSNSILTIPKEVKFCPQF